MTFELSSEHAAVRDDARALAGTISETASEIDHSATVPADLAARMRAFGEKNVFALAIAVEEVAVVSAAVAVAAAGTPDGPALSLTGLRGAREIDATPRGQLVLAAAALGIGRAALTEALAALRQSSSQQSADVEKPHWVIADVATDLDAARLLTYKAARSGSEAEIGMARLMASAAANRAVDAAIRIVGASALSQGSLIERLARDVRAVSVVSGTEEDQRAAAAEGLLPQ